MLFASQIGEGITGMSWLLSNTLDPGSDLYTQDETRYEYFELYHSQTKDKKIKKKKLTQIGG